MTKKILTLCFTLLVVIGIGAHEPGRPFQVEVIGSGRPMILIPGLASHGDTWVSTAEHFATSHESHILTLEGFAGVPAIVAYKTNWLTAWAAKRMMLVSHICLVNIILDRQCVPEFIQQRCRADLLAAALTSLLDDPQARATQIDAGRRAVEILGLGGPAPSDRAADVVLGMIAEGDRKSA